MFSVFVFGNYIFLFKFPSNSTFSNQLFYLKFQHLQSGVGGSLVARAGSHNGDGGAALVHVSGVRRLASHAHVSFEFGRTRRH